MPGTPGNLSPPHARSKLVAATGTPQQRCLSATTAAAQARLCQGSVLIVGAGGLGSPAALYLAAAGVGRLGIVDRDSVELSNIHRQVIHR